MVERLRAEGWDARTLSEQFGDEHAQRISDEEWITRGSLAGFFLITKDHRIASRELEAHAIYYSEARVIVFSRGDLSAGTMGDILVAHRSRIDRLASVAPPFVFSISAQGVTRKRLNAP